MCFLSCIWVLFSPYLAQAWTPRLQPVRYGYVVCTEHFWPAGWIIQRARETPRVSRFQVFAGADEECSLKISYGRPGVTYSAKHPSAASSEFSSFFPSPVHVFRTRTRYGSGVSSEEGAEASPKFQENQKFLLKIRNAHWYVGRSHWHILVGT